MFCEHFDQGFSEITDQSKKDNLSAAGTLKAHLFALCSYTAAYLFDSKDVRVHFRCLMDGKYEKAISTIGEGLYEEDLHPIPCDKGMICEAGKAKRSMIKSLNLELHEGAKHDHIWEEYITMVFDDFYEEGIPYLSMGISIKNKGIHKNLLYFLNHVRIEQLIEQKLKQIAADIDFKAALTEIALSTKRKD